MSKNKKYVPEVKVQDAPVASEPATPSVQSETAVLHSDPVLSLEQVALTHGAKATPIFKAHHLPSLLAFCKSTGLPTSGSEKEMKDVLRKYGYKI